MQSLRAFDGPLAPFRTSAPNVCFRPKADIGVTLCQASLGACRLTDLSKPAKSVRWKRYRTKIGLLDAAGNVVMLALCAIGWRKAPVTAEGY